MVYGCDFPKICLGCTRIRGGGGWQSVALDDLAEKKDRLGMDIGKCLFSMT